MPNQAKAFKNDHQQIPPELSPKLSRYIKLVNARDPSHVHTKEILKGIKHYVR